MTTSHAVVRDRPPRSRSPPCRTRRRAARAHRRVHTNLVTPAHPGRRDARFTMFDEVIVAVDNNEAALDALALGKTLASPVAALTLAHVEADGSEDAERADVDSGPARDTQPPTPLLSLSD